jgi:hypothetical protein
VGVPQIPLLSTTGPKYLQLLLASRVVRVRLERRINEIESDLGWKTVATQELPILGFEGTIVSWSAEIELPVSLPPRRPGSSQTWRVVVEEWERLPADRVEGERGGGLEARMVYADHLPL